MVKYMAQKNDRVKPRTAGRGGPFSEATMPTGLPVGLRSNAQTHHLQGVCHNNESIGVRVTDHAFESWQFPESNHRVQDLFRLIRISSPSLENRRTPPYLMENASVNLLPLGQI